MLRGVGRYYFCPSKEHGGPTFPEALLWASIDQGGLEAVAPPGSGWMKRKVSALSACFFRSLDCTSVVLTTGKGKAGGVWSLKDEAL